MLIPRVVNTIIEAAKFASYNEAGAVMDMHSASNDMNNNYRPMYISGGIVVQVMDGNKLMGYLRAA